MDAELLKVILTAFGSVIFSGSMFMYLIKRSIHGNDKRHDTRKKEVDDLEKKVHTMEKEILQKVDKEDFETISKVLERINTDLAILKNTYEDLMRIKERTENINADLKVLQSQLNTALERSAK